MSYMNISSSSTTTRRFLFSRTARMADGYVNSQMVDDLCKKISSYSSAHCMVDSDLGVSDYESPR